MPATVLSARKTSLSRRAQPPQPLAHSSQSGSPLSLCTPQTQGGTSRKFVRFFWSPIQFLKHRSGKNTLRGLNCLRLQSQKRTVCKQLPGGWSFRRVRATGAGCPSAALPAYLPVAGPSAAGLLSHCGTCWPRWKERAWHLQPTPTPTQSTAGV